MEKLYMGSAFYPEIYGKDLPTFEQDVAMMKKGGFNAVRIAEFSWSCMEPHDGVFDFGETGGARTIEISCFIPPGKSDEDFLSRKDDVIAWLSPESGLCDLILDKEPGRVYKARLDSGFSFDFLPALYAVCCCCRIREA